MIRWKRVVATLSGQILRIITFASSAGEKDEANSTLWLATRADILACLLCREEKVVIFMLYSKSFIKHTEKERG